MNYFQSILLGFVQGVAEFLPISSSGHLSILQNVFGLASTEADHMFFDVLLHLGTLLAVILAYWREIKELVLEFFAMLHLRRLPAGQKPDRISRRMIAFLVIGTLPLFLVLPVKDLVDPLYGNLFFIGCALLVTGTLLFLADRMGRGGKDVKTASIADILIVGLAQALAVIPGLSRSGATIAAGLSRGFNREFAVKFSFFLSIPAVLGANILSFIDAVQADINWSLMPVYLAGVATAAVSGYLSISLLRYITRKNSFGGFCYYCWGAGLLTMVLFLIK